MTSEVTSDLKIEISDLNCLCVHASLACKGLLEMIDTMTTTGQLSFVDELDMVQCPCHHLTTQKMTFSQNRNTTAPSSLTIMPVSSVDEWVCRVQLASRNLYSNNACVPAVFKYHFRTVFHKSLGQSDNPPSSSTSD